MAAVCCASALWAQSRPLPVRSLLQNQVPNPFGTLLPLFFLTFYSSLRANIGDTVFYRHSYLLYLAEGAPKIPLKLQGNGLFNTLQYLCSQLPEMRFNHVPQHGQLLIMINAVLFVVPAVLVLYQYSEGFSSALYLFVMTGVYLASMNGMRQYIAAGILLLGTHFFFHPNWKKGFLCFLPFVLVAWLLHSSAPVMLLFFFIARVRAYSKWSYLIVTGSIAAVLLSSILMPGFLTALEDTDFAAYSTTGWFDSGQESGASLLRAAVAVIPLVVGYHYRDRLQETGVQGNILINLGFIHAAIHILGLYNWIFIRLSIYLYIYQILLLCKIFALARERLGRWNLIGLSGMGLFAVYGYFMNTWILQEYRSLWLSNWY